MGQASSDPHSHQRFHARGEPLATDDQSHDDLFTVRPMVTGVAAPGLGVESGLPLEISARSGRRAGPGVREDEETTLPLCQGRFDFSAVRVQAVEVPIQRIVGEG